MRNDELVSTMGTRPAALCSRTVAGGNAAKRSVGDGLVVGTLALPVAGDKTCGVMHQRVVACPSAAAAVR